MKGSIQLSANFIVVIVLTMMVLGTGFAIFIPMITQAGEVPAQIDDYCDNYLDIALRDTDYAFCRNNLEIEKGKQGIAWLGIVNKYDNNACFKISEEGIVGEYEVSGLTVIDILPLVLDSQNTGSIGILVDAKTAEKGTYAITIKIDPKAEGCSNGYSGSDSNSVKTATRKLFVKVV